MPAKWHPVETVRPSVWVFPEPGTPEPYAEIRHLSIVVDGVPVWCFRAVRVNVEPRELIGYFGNLRDAAKGCHMHAIGQVGKGVLSRMDAYDTRP